MLPAQPFFTTKEVAFLFKKKKEKMLPRHVHVFK